MILGIGRTYFRKAIDDVDGPVEDCLAVGSETYVKEACTVREDQMKRHNLHYPSNWSHRSNSPISSSSCCPEVDITSFCTDTLPTL